MIKDVCLKWADDSREVQSVAGGITVQKQERQVSEPPLSEPQIYFSQNGCRRDFYINKELWKGRTSLWSSAWRCNISSKEGNFCNFGISRGQWVSTFCWLNISSNSIWHFNRSVQITSVSLLEVQSCFSQCNATGLNHYPLWNLDFYTLRQSIL